MPQFVVSLSELTNSCASWNRILCWYSGRCTPWRGTIFGHVRRFLNVTYMTKLKVNTINWNYFLHKINNNRNKT